MSFLARLGLSLLIFGAVTLIAHAFGYTPRKLANLPPEGIRAAGIAFLALGGLLLATGGGPRVRKAVLIGLGSLLGLGVLAVAAALIFARRPKPTPPGPPPSSWNAPTAMPAPPSATPPTGAQPMPTSPAATLHEKRRRWTERFGREKVWNVVVHLRGTSAPENLESVLAAASSDPAQGGAAVSHLGGLIEAVVAPSDEAAVQKALTTLFPGSDIRVTAAARNAVVFAR